MWASGVRYFEQRQFGVFDLRAGRLRRRAIARARRIETRMRHGEG